jgi:hypothetical protein
VDRRRREESLLVFDRRAAYGRYSIPLTAFTGPSDEILRYVLLEAVAAQGGRRPEVARVRSRALGTRDIDSTGSAD